MASRGPGAMQPAGLVESWGGRRAQQYVQLTLAEYGTTCWLCGLPGADSADHVIPVARGGAVFDLRNFGPAHRPCNYSRGARPAEQYDLIENGEPWFTAA